MVADEAVVVQSIARVASGVCVEICKKAGVATLRLSPTWTLAALRDALDACKGAAGELHAIFLCIVPAEPAVQAETQADGPTPSASATLPASAATGVDCALLDALVERFGECQFFVVAFVERDAGCAETCLLAACDVVIAAPAVELAMVAGLHVAGWDGARVGGGGVVPAAAVPLSLLRICGPTLWDRWQGASGNVQPPRSLSAGLAMELGLVSEVLASLEAMPKRREEMSLEFRKGSTAVLAAQRWAARRSARGRARAATFQQRSRGGFTREREWDVDTPEAKRRRVEASDAPDLAVAPEAASPKDLCDIVIGELLRSPEKLFAPQGLLRKIVSTALGTPHDKREKFQAEVVEMVSAELGAIESADLAFVDNVSAMLDHVDAEREAREAALVAAESRHVEAICAVSDAKAHLAHATAELRNAVEALAAEQSAEASGNAALDDAVSKKAKLETAERDTFVPLRDGVVTGAKAKRQSATLVALGKQFDFDDTLLMGLPGALSQKPSARTDCDDMFLKAFHAELETRIAEIDTEITKGEPEREARAGKVQAAREVHNTARERQQAASDGLTQAGVAVDKHKAAIERYREAVRVFKPDILRLERDVKAARNRLVVLQAGPLAAFSRLRRQTTAEIEEAARVAEANAAAIASDAEKLGQVAKMPSFEMAESSAPTEPYDVAEATGMAHVVHAAQEEENGEKASEEHAGVGEGATQQREDQMQTGAGEQAVSATEVGSPQRTDDSSMKIVFRRGGAPLEKTVGEVTGPTVFDCYADTVVCKTQEDHDEEEEGAADVEIVKAEQEREKEE